MLLRAILTLLHMAAGCHKKPKKHHATTVQLYFGRIGEIMANAVLHTDDNGVSASLVFKDKKGNVTAPAKPPVWTVSSDTVVAMTVAADGMSATFAPSGVGSVDVDVVAEGDVVDGVDTLHATGHIDVLAAEAATVDLSFGPVS